MPVSVRHSLKIQLELLEAVDANNYKKVKQLIELGADVNYKSKKGYSALMIAAALGYIEIVTFLLKNGADVEIEDIDGETPFLFAAKMCNNTKMIDLLIEHGCNIFARNKYNDNALFLCAEYNSSLEMIQYLEKLGFEVDDSNDIVRYTPLMVAARFNKNYEIVKYIADKVYKTRNLSGYDDKWLHIDKDGWSELMHAAANEWDDSFNLLLVLQYDKDLARKNNEGKTALDIAKEFGNSRIAKLLTELTHEVENKTV